MTKKIFKTIIFIILAILTGGSASVFIKNEDGVITIDSAFNIELSEAQVPTEIETEDGSIEIIKAPTVEEVDGNPVAECGENKECGKGWWVDVSTPQTFKDAVIGKCIDLDQHFGSQCWDLSSLFFENTAGRFLSTCGTGAAKGALNCYEENAGDDFIMVWNPEELQPGDILIFNNGTYGHTGMAMGYYNNGYIAMLGTNQGGSSCEGGGSSANIINISLKSFAGAFRWKKYVKEEKPSIPISNCTSWNVEQGDTMSKIMLQCENTVVYGEAMNAYADSWRSTIIKPGQTVYEGWVRDGVGLYFDDIIEHEVSK